MWIRTFLFLHVLGAVTALGPTLTYGLWARRGEAAGPAQRAFALRTISWIDRRLATPSYMLQAVTGTVLIFLRGWDFFGEGWLVLGVILYVVMTVTAVAFYAPAFRRQRTLAERLEVSPDDEERRADYGAAAARANALGVAAIVLTLAILFLMVWKPVLWS